jgi:hypothetical protein
VAPVKVAANSTGLQQTEVIVGKGKRAQGKKRAVGADEPPASRRGDALPAEPAGLPDGASPDGGPTDGRVDTGRPVQTNIEQADERKLGPIETVLQPDPEDSVTGFVEPAAGEEAGGRRLPPLLDEG